MPRLWLLIGALLGGLAVVAGAFGAHGLRDKHTPEQLQTYEVERKLDTFETAVRYQMYHALALMLVGVLALHHPSGWLSAAGVAFLVGVAIFSGLLYVYVFTGLKVLGAIVPIGGVALIVGWLLLAVGAWRTVSR